MFFPPLHIPGLGDGMTIALNAVLHVLISHGVAIGMMTMLALFQTLAWRGRGVFWAQTVRTLLGPVVVIITSVGAVTGVGIWFITGALASEGIGSLIHLFFWPWFIEWGAFTLEVVLLLIYYFLWDRLAPDRPGALVALGWGYVAVAVCSAILITGILGFMLTPDGWPWGQSFREAYFNPTFVPQCFLRVAGGISLGALFVLTWTAWRYRGSREERGRILRLGGGVFLGAALVTTVSAFVYFSRVPATYLTHWKFAVATSALAQVPLLLPVVNALAALVLLLFALMALSRRTGWCRALSIPALILSVGLVTEFERIREFVRGPYLIPGYMYANQILLEEHQAIPATHRTLLSTLSWVNDNGHPSADTVAAQALFEANCAVCHTENGINDIRTRLAGRTRDGVDVIIGLTEHLAPFMAPFTGSDDERMLLANYLYTLTNQSSPRHALTLPNSQPSEDK